MPQNSFPSPGDLSIQFMVYKYLSNMCLKRTRASWVLTSGWLAAARRLAHGGPSMPRTSSSQPRLHCRPYLSVSLFFRGAGKLLWFHRAVNSKTFFHNYILWPLRLENHNGFTAAIILLKRMHVSRCLWREADELISTPFVVSKKWPCFPTAIINQMF